MARNKNLELIASTKRTKCSYFFFFICLFIYLFIYCNLSSYQNKRVALIELPHEKGQNAISYSQLRKSEISLVKKFETIEIYLFPTLYLKSKYI